MEASNLPVAAMVSRLRVEVRGETMEAAERAAFLMLEHARAAGLMEGIVHDAGGEFTDHHFQRPNVTRKFSDGPEPWSELGLSYEGRLVFTFEPGLVRGGLKEFGFEVTQVDNYMPHGLAGHEGSKEEPVRTDVTDKVIVLHRANEVTREHVWEGTPSYEAALAAEIAEGEATAEGVLDNIRRLDNVMDVKVGYDYTQRDGTGWRVEVMFESDRGDQPMAASASGETLREAALSAYGMCGVEVTHYATGGPLTKVVADNLPLGLKPGFPPFSS